MTEPITFSFSQHLQDCLLILGIEDDEVAKYLALLVTADNFISDNSAIICKLIVKFYTEFKVAPREHFADLVEEELKKLPESKVTLFVEYVHKLHEIFPNKDYVLSHLSQFVRYNNVIKAIIDGAKLIDGGQYESAEKRITGAFRTGIRTGYAGIDYLNDLDMRASPDDVLFRTEVEALDKIMGGISRKELTVWLASTNIGKSWALVHCAKAALVQRLKILHYTLEMTAPWVATRVDMGVCAMGTREEVITLPHLGEAYRVKSVFEHKKEVVKAIRFLKRLGGRLHIMGVPEGGLTLGKMIADLELLEATKAFIPDVIIVDYADLMTPETSYTDYRHDLAVLYKGLRQIALDRNCAMITASQSNRASIGARVVSLKHFAEDIQKANIADIVLSLCQTDDEAKQSKMRVFCCKNRSGVKGFQVENYYSYHIGQFSLYSKLYEESEIER